MRPRTLTALAAVGLAVAVPAANAFSNEPMRANSVLGTASKTCKAVSYTHLTLPTIYSV